MIDLFGYSEVLLLYSFSEIEGSVTITIKDVTGAVTIGTIKLDQARLRPFTAALGEIAKVYYDDLSAIPQGYRMNFNINQNKAEVAFG